MKKVIVTGGAGFIGSHLVDKLIGQNIEVNILDDLSTGKKEYINPKAHLMNIDISEPLPLALFSGVDTVFHLAAKARVQPSIQDPITFNKSNVGGTLNILHCAHRAGVKRVIYSSSSSCYGNTNIFPTPETAPISPLSPYGLQKHIGEQYCKMFSEIYGLDTISLRYFNVYGKRMSLEGAYRLAIPIFASQIKNNQPCTINNDGNQKRDFTYVSDVVEANILAANSLKNFNGKSFNIGNGFNYSINSLVEMMGGRKSYGNKVIEPFETLADNSLAKKELNWHPKGNLKDWISNNFKK